MLWRQGQASDTVKRHVKSPTITSPAAQDRNSVLSHLRPTGKRQHRHMTVGASPYHMTPPQRRPLPPTPGRDRPLERAALVSKPLSVQPSATMRRKTPILHRCRVAGAGAVPPYLPPGPWSTTSNRPGARKAGGGGPAGGESTTQVGTRPCLPLTGPSRDRTCPAR